MIEVNDYEQAITEIRFGKELGKGSADIAKIEAERTALKALLPKKSDELLGWLRTKGNDVSRVLAYCVAVSVDAVVFDEKNRAAEPLAQALKLDMRTRWSAGDDYLLRISQAQINAALMDAGKANFTGHQLKKAELVAKAKPLLANWLPKFMRFTGEKT